jgi:hypothetical protein
MRKVCLYKDFPEKNPRTTALCLSGGGARAFAAGLGQLQALQKLGLLRHIDYLSAVSGGGWLSLLATYVPDVLPALLGDVRVPSELSSDVLSQPNGRLGSLVTGSLVEDDRQLPKGLPRSKRWVELMRHQFLDPFGLGHVQWGQESAPCARIEGWPYLVISAALLWPNDFWHTHHTQLMQWTPDYGGILTEHHHHGRIFGGGFCALPGVDTVLSARHVREAEVGSSGFGLAEMMACTSAFYARAFDHFPTLRAYSPYLEYWSPIAGVSHTYSVGDGGFVDNLGLLPMLQRQVQRIMVCINTSMPLRQPRLDPEMGWLGVDDALPPLFGEHAPGQPMMGQKRPLTQVFSSEDWRAWLQMALASGGVFTQTLTVVQNDYFSIKPYTVEIVWVYHALHQDWCQRLSGEVHDLLQSRHLHHFPYYPTLGENFHWYDASSWETLGMLDALEVNLLASLTAWVVLQNSSSLRLFFNTKYM